MMERWLEGFARANFLRSTDTAHDLKTPLNVAVLNLELLRMRLRKLTDGTDDPKIVQYSQAIEVELRRMASIFDAFFVLSTPPKGEEAPPPLDLVPICREEAIGAGFAGEGLDGSVSLAVHESRIRQAFKLFFEGAARLLKKEGQQVSVGVEDGFSVTISGPPATDELDLTKIFKFYYTDPSGQPDLSFAAARLICETYGGGLNASGESDKVVLRMSFPPGEE